MMSSLGLLGKLGNSLMITDLLEQLTEDLWQFHNNYCF